MTPGVRGRPSGPASTSNSALTGAVPMRYRRSRSAFADGAGRPSPSGALLGVDPATISHATHLTAELLASARIPLPPTAQPPAILPRTPAELLHYAAAAGHTLTIPENGQTMPEHFKPRQRRPPTRPKPPT